MESALETGTTGMQDAVAAAYDSAIDEECRRLTDIPFGAAEFTLTIDLLDRYIRPRSAVADIGCGPGRYAEHLLARDCRIGAVDLSKRSLLAFLERIPTSRAESVLFAVKGNAIDLRFIPDESMDAALLMGPLYHLPRPGDRRKAVLECLRIIKPGGIILSTFLSAGNGGPGEGHGAEFTDSMATSVFFGGYEIPQIRHRPEAARSFMEACGVTTLHIRDLDVKAAMGSYSGCGNGSDSAELMEFLRNTCDNRDTAEMNGHYIYVGKKRTGFRATSPN
jgi:SAM-dependent methyltransferase